VALPARAWSLLGDLCVWSGLYGAACVVSAFLITDTPIWWEGTLGAGLATSGVYLVDRIKLRDRDWDPADLAANKRRHTRLRSRKHAARLLALACLTSASVLLWERGRVTGLLPWGGCLGVMLYAPGRSPGARPKDVPVLKNALVATGMTLLAGVVLRVRTEGPTPGIAFALSWLWVTVLADALLSDLDDRETDQVHGTRTVPTHGVRLAWGLGAGLALLGALGLVLVGHDPAARRLGVWCLLTTLVLWGLRPGRVRDLIDWRLPLIVGAELLIDAGA